MDAKLVLVFLLLKFLPIIIVSSQRVGGGTRPSVGGGTRPSVGGAFRPSGGSSSSVSVNVRPPAISTNIINGAGRLPSPSNIRPPPAPVYSAGGFVAPAIAAPYPVGNSRVIWSSRVGLPYYGSSINYPASRIVAIAPVSPFRLRPIYYPAQPCLYPQCWNSRVTQNVPATRTQQQHIINTNSNENCNPAQFYGIDSGEQYYIYGGSSSSGVDANGNVPRSAFCNFVIAASEGARLNVALYSNSCYQWPVSCSLTVADYDTSSGNILNSLIDISTDRSGSCPTQTFSGINAVSISVTGSCSQQGVDFSFQLTVSVPSTKNKGTSLLKRSDPMLLLLFMPVLLYKSVL